MHVCFVCGCQLVTYEGKCLLPPSLPAQAWERIHTREVVTMARMVPTGIDFWASRRSPERFEPAMMPSKTIRFPQGLPRRGGQARRVGKKGLPVTEGKKMPTSTVKDVAMSATTYRARFSFRPRASVEGSPCFSTTSPFSR